jgi:hypothetical protein
LFQPLGVSDTIESSLVGRFVGELIQKKYTR